MPPASAPVHTRRYAVFISYRHSDNREMGRQWANWLHEALESYEVPPDLVGTSNQRGDPVPASLYPVFRDEEELPADADLSANIRRALENSGLLVVICSPRSAQSRFVADEIRYFKELGKSDRILALIIDGEPNASDDPANMQTFGVAAECFPEPLRFGVPSADDPKRIDWTARTEPIAADVRPEGRAEQGWTTAAAYGDRLGSASNAVQRQIVAKVGEYSQRLNLAVLKLIAGALGLPLGELTQRDKVHQLAKVQQRAKALRRWLAAVMALTFAACIGGIVAWQQKGLAEHQTRRAIIAEAQTAAQLEQTVLQLERSELAQGRTWLQQAKAAMIHKDHLSAIMLAGRSVGYDGYGRLSQESPEFVRQFPLLLGKRMTNSMTEKERLEETRLATKFFIDIIRPTCLPLWSGAMEETIGCVAFSPDSTRLVSGSYDKTIAIWDASTGKKLMSLSGHISGVDCVAFSPDGSLLASCGGDLRLWNAYTGEVVGTSKSDGGVVTSVAFCPDNSRFASAHSNNSITLWASATGKELATLVGHTGRVKTLAFSPDGGCLASGSDDKTVKLWNVASCKELLTLSGQGAVNAVAFSPNGHHLAIAYSDCIRLWDVAANKEVISMQGAKNLVTSVAFDRHGSRIASGWSRGIRIWDAATGGELACLPGDMSAVFAVAFSPDGTRLASVELGGTIRLWDTSPGDEFVSLDGHTSAVTSVASCPGDTLLASGSWDKTIRLWDSATGRELAILDGHSDTVNSVAFDPTGARLASTCNDKTIKLWDVASGREITGLIPGDAAQSQHWLDANQQRQNADNDPTAKLLGERILIMPPNSQIDLTAPIRAGLLSMASNEIVFPPPRKSSSICHVRQDILEQLANPNLGLEKRAELQMQLSAATGQHWAAMALWQRLLRGQWFGFEGAIAPKDNVPTSVPDNSPIRRLYLMALIDATRRANVIGHTTASETAAMIAPTLTKEMMMLPTVSLGMMTLMQTLAKDDSVQMAAPRTALLERLEEVATSDWLRAMRYNTSDTTK